RKHSRGLAITDTAPHIVGGLHRFAKRGFGKRYSSHHDKRSERAAPLEIGRRYEPHASRAAQATKSRPIGTSTSSEGRASSAAVAAKRARDHSAMFQRVSSSGRLRAASRMDARMISSMPTTTR